MAIVWLLIGAALVIVVASFGAQNADAVDLQFYGYRFTDVPLWLLLVVPAAVGLLLGFLLGLPARVRAALDRRRLNAQLLERNKTVGALEQRTAELERDLAVARRPAIPAVADEPPEVPDGTTRPQVQAA
jgi:uncharacterized integral membrane protein